VRPPEKHWGKWKGLGLFSIRERLHAFGGTIRILSSRGKGTTVILVAPRRADAPPETAAKGERKK
jgi:signal transduction histidine kinase